MTLEEGQQLINITNQFCMDHVDSKVTKWATSALLATLKVKIEEIIKKEAKIGTPSIAEKA